MATFDYNRYQIFLRSDSKKTQGLQTGDIVRRQYFDGKNLIYSLMCVLSYGVEKTNNKETGEIEERPYFIGALLEGDVPHRGELLDFARVTNLFNRQRSGAMYLTSSDSDAPYMDVLDNLAKNQSLSWPESIATQDSVDSLTQYVISSPDKFRASFTQSDRDNERILTATRVGLKGSGFEGLKQDFYQFVENPNRILISYKIRADKPMISKMSLGYTNELKYDAEWTEQVTTEWEYKLHVITIDYSGRHLRSFRASLKDLVPDSSIQFADLNIVLLSSISNFADASAIRIGKLDGIIDPVFGKLDGYGAFLQKLYATSSAHISGTLTAGDENGFGATFYAGRIHRNCFVNSIGVEFVGNGAEEDTTVVNPTGIGKVYRSTGAIKMFAQTSSWKKEHLDNRYCLSFWVYSKAECQFEVLQNDKVVGAIVIPPYRAYSWQRVSVKFKVLNGERDQDNVYFGIVPTFYDSSFVPTEPGQIAPDEKVYYISAPQLEPGIMATQYQATDGNLNYTDEYGAWFSRGGIGGTIQNPLLKLNDDGSISSRTGSFVINHDGTGYFANRRMEWSQDKITLRGVKVSWDSFDDETQDMLKSKSIKIIGETVFTIDHDVCTPKTITITVSETNFEANPENFRWYYLDSNNEYAALSNGIGKSYTIDPNGVYWESRDSLTVKCVANFNQVDYVDTITIQKSRHGEDAYSVQIYSSNGTTFKNGYGETVLTAHVFKGGEDITTRLFMKDFDWIKTSKDPVSDEQFNAAHVGVGNSITVTSDNVWETAQFDCIVRIN